MVSVAKSIRGLIDFKGEDRLSRELRRAQSYLCFGLSSAGLNDRWRIFCCLRLLVDFS